MKKSKTTYIILTAILVVIIAILGFLLIRRIYSPIEPLPETELERLKIDDSFYVDLSPTLVLENNTGSIDIRMINQGKKDTITIKAQIPNGLTLKIRNREFTGENFDDVQTLGEYNLAMNADKTFTIAVNGTPTDENSLVLYFNDYQQTINIIDQGQNVDENHQPQDYYVAKDGVDSNDGSVDFPWQTIQKAAETARAGDTVYVKAGTYAETVKPKHSGLDGKLITFTSYENDEVIIEAQEGYGFYLGYGVNYVKIDGFTIIKAIGAGAITDYPKTSSVVHGAGIKISASQYNIISNNVLYDNDIGIFVSIGAPFGLDGEAIVAENNQLLNNTIYNSGEAGIRIKRSDYTTVDGNIVYHNGYPENPVYDEPAAGITYYCTIGTTVSNNTVYNNSASAIDNYAGTNSETCDSQSTVIKNNVLSQTNPNPMPDKFYTGEKTVLIIAEKEITDQTNLYQYNTFYNGVPGSNLVIWGLASAGEAGELMTFEQYVASAQQLNPNSGIGDQEATENPIN